MPTTTRQRSLADRLRAATADVTDLPTLADAVFAALARAVPYDFTCFATTDPATGLIAWTAKSRPLEVGEGGFAAAEYGPPDLNSFAELAVRRPPVGAVCLDTGGRVDDCRRMRDFMRPEFGFTDELRLVFVSRGASWGALATYRGAGEPPFSADDVAAVGAASELLAEAVQRCLFREPASLPIPQQVPPVATEGPAVLVVGADDHVTHLSPAAQAAIDDLGGWDHGELPANLLVAIVTTRTKGRPTETRAQGRSGRWLSLRVAPLAGPAERSDVVVTVEPAPRAALSRMAFAAHGLSAREEEVALLVLQGADTKAIAAALFLSPHTVQDHLKAIFAKLGVTSRRELTARLVLR